LAAHAAGRARKTGNLGIHVQVEVDFRSHGAGARFVIDLTRESKASGRHGKVCAEASFTDERTVAGGGNGSSPSSY